MHTSSREWCMDVGLLGLDGGMSSTDCRCGLYLIIEALTEVNMVTTSWVAALLIFINSAAKTQKNQTSQMGKSCWVKQIQLGIGSFKCQETWFFAQDHYRVQLPLIKADNGLLCSHVAGCLTTLTDAHQTAQSGGNVRSAQISGTLCC